MALVLVFFVVMALVAQACVDSWNREKRRKDAYKFPADPVMGSAKYATNAVLRKAGMFKPSGIRIGYSPDGRRKLWYRGFGHLLLVASARSGKALTVLVTAILSLGKNARGKTYSLLLFDPKGELTAICGDALLSKGEVFVLNPFGILPEALKRLKMACYNPFGILDPLSSGFHAACDKLAEALCPDEIGGNEKHWILSARLLLSGIIAALSKFGSESEKNLIAMRTVLTGAAGNSVFDFCRECMALPDQFIRQKLSRFSVPDAEESKELNSIISTADTCTGFLANEAIAESVQHSDFNFRDLKRRPGTTVSIILPLNKLDVCSAYFRLIMAAALSDLLEEGLKGQGAPVLAVVDEAAQMGRLKALEDASGMAAGAAGLAIWWVYQSRAQIATQFPRNHTTIVQNCGASLFFGIRDPESQEMVSKMAGTTEVLNHSRNVTLDRITGEPQVSDGASQTSRPLIYPHEVGELASDEMLVFCESVNGVVRAKRKPYTDEPGLDYSENPYYDEPGLFKSLFDSIFGS